MRAFLEGGCIPGVDNSQTSSMIGSEPGTPVNTSDVPTSLPSNQDAAGASGVAPSDAPSAAHGAAVDDSGVRESVDGVVLHRKLADALRDLEVQNFHLTHPDDHGAATVGNDAAATGSDAVAHASDTATQVSDVVAAALDTATQVSDVVAPPSDAAVQGPDVVPRGSDATTQAATATSDAADGTAHDSDPTAAPSDAEVARPAAASPSPADGPQSPSSADAGGDPRNSREPATRDLTGALASALLGRLPASRSPSGDASPEPSPAMAPPSPTVSHPSSNAAVVPSQVRSPPSSPLGVGQPSAPASDGGGAESRDFAASPTFDMASTGTLSLPSPDAASSVAPPTSPASVTREEREWVAALSQAVLNGTVDSFDLHLDGSLGSDSGSDATPADAQGAILPASDVCSTPAATAPPASPVVPAEYDDHSADDAEAQREAPTPTAVGAVLAPPPDSPSSDGVGAVASDAPAPDASGHQPASDDEPHAHPDAGAAMPSVSALASDGRAPHAANAAEPGMNVDEGVTGSPGVPVSTVASDVDAGASAAPASHNDSDDADSVGRAADQNDGDGTPNTDAVPVVADAVDADTSNTDSVPVVADAVDADTSAAAAMNESIHRWLDSVEATSEAAHATAQGTDPNPENDGTPQLRRADPTGAALSVSALSSPTLSVTAVAATPVADVLSPTPPAQHGPEDGGGSPLPQLGHFGDDDTLHSIDIAPAPTSPHAEGGGHSDGGAVSPGGIEDTAREAPQTPEPVGSPEAAGDVADNEAGGRDPEVEGGPAQQPPRAQSDGAGTPAGGEGTAAQGSEAAGAPAPARVPATAAANDGRNNDDGAGSDQAEPPLAASATQTSPPETSSSSIRRAQHAASEAHRRFQEQMEAAQAAQRQAKRTPPRAPPVRAVSPKQAAKRRSQELNDIMLVLSGRATVTSVAPRGGRRVRSPPGKAAPRAQPSRRVASRRPRVSANRPAAQPSRCAIDEETKRYARILAGAGNPLRRSLGGTRGGYSSDDDY